MQSCACSIEMHWLRLLGDEEAGVLPRSGPLRNKERIEGWFSRGQGTGKDPKVAHGTCTGLVGVNRQRGTRRLESSKEPGAEWS